MVRAKKRKTKEQNMEVMQQLYQLLTFTALVDTFDFSKEQIEKFHKCFARMVLSLKGGILTEAEIAETLEKNGIDFYDVLVNTDTYLQGIKKAYADVRTVKK